MAFASDYLLVSNVLKDIIISLVEVNATAPLVAYLSTSGFENKGDFRHWALKIREIFWGPVQGLPTSFPTAYNEL